MSRLLAAIGLVALVTLAVTDCGQSTGTAPTPSSTPAGSPAIASPITGIVTAVDSQGLGSVKGFTLRTRDGHIIQIAIGTLENGASFPPGHLAEHLATAEPVRVYFREEAGALVAYRIEDAGAPASASAGASSSGSPSPSAS